MSKLNTLAGTIAPASWKETLLWAAKTAVFAFIGVAGANALDWTNLDALKAAATAGAAAGAGVIINRLLAWASSP